MKVAHVLLTSLALLGSSAFGRTWTSIDGRTIKATLIKQTGDSVIVDRGGREVTIPLDKLAKVDRDWLANQAEKATPGKGPAIDTAQISKILEGTLKEEPSDAERQKVVDFFVSVLPSKGAEGEAVEWDVNFSPWGGDEERTSVLISANMHTKGDEKDRLMWFHFVFSTKDKVEGSDKVAGYPAMRAKDRHCFLAVKRTDVRGVAHSESYEDDKKIEAIIKSIDLKAISKL